MVEKTLSPHLKKKLAYEKYECSSPSKCRGEGFFLMMVGKGRQEDEREEGGEVKKRKGFAVERGKTSLPPPPSLIERGITENQILFKHFSK